MSAYYEPSQWPPTGQPGWDHQTPPPARSGMIYCPCDTFGSSAAVVRMEADPFSRC